MWFLVMRISFQTVLVLRKISSILEHSRHKGYNKNREQWCEIKFSYMFLLTLLIYYYSNSEVEFTASKALVSIETTCPTCGKRVYFFNTPCLILDCVRVCRRAHMLVFKEWNLPNLWVLCHYKWCFIFPDQLGRYLVLEDPLDDIYQQ